MEDRDFVSSNIDPCVYYKENCIVFIYVDDCIIVSKHKSIINNFISSIQSDKEKYIFTDNGEIDKHPGVNIVKTQNSIITKQPYLIERCLQDMEITEGMNIKKVQVSKPLLYKDKRGAPIHHSWHYRTMIGVLDFLKRSTRPELTMGVHVIIFLKIQNVHTN